MRHWRSFWVPTRARLDPCLATHAIIATSAGSSRFALSLPARPAAPMSFLEQMHAHPVSHPIEGIPSEEGSGSLRGLWTTTQGSKRCMGQMNAAALIWQNKQRTGAPHHKASSKIDSQAHPLGMKRGGLGASSFRSHTMHPWIATDASCIPRGRYPRSRD